MRITESQLRRIIREERVSASQDYLAGPEAAMSRTQSALARRLIDLLPAQGSPEHLEMLSASMDDQEITDPALRSMIIGALKMIPPHSMITQLSTISQKSRIR